MINPSAILKKVNNEVINKKIRLYKKYLNNLFKKYDECKSSKDPVKCKSECSKKIKHWKKILSDWKVKIND